MEAYCKVRSFHLLNRLKMFEKEVQFGSRIHKRTLSRPFHKNCPDLEICMRKEGKEGDRRSKGAAHSSYPDLQSHPDSSDGAATSQIEEGYRKKIYNYAYVAATTTCASGTFSSAWPNGMSHRKWRETKQQLIRLPDLALLDCCLVSLHFLCDIPFGHAVVLLRYKRVFNYTPKSQTTTNRTE